MLNLHVTNRSVNILQKQQIWSENDFFQEIRANVIKSKYIRQYEM